MRIHYNLNNSKKNKSNEKSIYYTYSIENITPYSSISAYNGFVTLISAKKYIYYFLKYTI